jgi:hypothetical protein
MEETDSERNIRIGKQIGAKVVQASGTVVGLQEERTTTTDWKRDQIDQVVKDALFEGITDPEEIRRRKLEKIEQLKDI